MMFRPALHLLRCLTMLLTVVGLLVAAQARAAMAVQEDLMAVEICHDEAVVTIWVDADGKEHVPPHECADCCLCSVPAPWVPPRSALVAGRDAVGVPVPASALNLRLLRADYLIPPSRGPPSLQSRIASA